MTNKEYAAILRKIADYLDSLPPSLEELDDLCHNAATLFGIGRQIKQKMYDMGVIELDELSGEGRKKMAEYVESLMEYEAQE